MFATKARKSVESSRLVLDSTKASKKSAALGRSFNPDDEVALSEEARAQIEAKEDDFVGQVEEAQSVMKNVRSPLYLWQQCTVLTEFGRSSTLQSLSAIWLI